MPKFAKRHLFGGGEIPYDWVIYFISVLIVIMLLEM
jgi:hypothetical protein